MRFDLPEILIAERAGRSIALDIKSDPSAVIETSLEGAAAFAALRHCHNRGFSTTAYLTDLNAESNSVFGTMLEVYGCMNLPLKQGGKPSGGEVIDATLNTLGGTIRARDYTVTPKNGWDNYSASNNPYLKPACMEQALPVKIIREIDRLAIEEFSLPGICLMENAGIDAIVVASEMLSKTESSGTVTVLVGFGNNGGDALVVARGLLEKGERVRVITLGDTQKLSGDAGENLKILASAFPDIELAPDRSGELDNLFAASRLVIDGIFGTGLSRAVEGKAAEVISSLNRSGRPVLSLDLPSGMAADTGGIMGVAVKASATVTFAAPKKGFWSGAGPELCGEITLADIGAPSGLLRGGDHA